MVRDVFQHQVTVSNEHLDELNHVNNVVYVQWIQDVAGAHWMKYASNAINDAFFWVVTRHEIDYKSSCQLGDVLNIKTQTPIEYKGATWDRWVWIYRSDGTLAVKATTTWCLIDRETLRPTRITPDIHQVFIDPKF